MRDATNSTTTRRAVLTAGAAATAWTVPVIQAAAATPAANGSHPTPPPPPTNLVSIKSVTTSDRGLGNGIDGTVKIALAAPAISANVTCVVEFFRHRLLGNPEFIAKQTIVLSPPMTAGTRDVSFGFHDWVVSAYYEVRVTVTSSVTQYTHNGKPVGDGSTTKWPQTTVVHTTDRFWVVN